MQESRLFLIFKIQINLIIEIDCNEKVFLPDKHIFSIVLFFFSENQNMKRITKILAFSVFLTTTFNSYAKKAQVTVEKDLYEYNNIIANINKVQKPFLQGDYIVFTADSSPRFVGIVFDFEDYKELHKFQRHIMRDIDGNVTNKVLFYLLKRPEDINHIEYRLVIDGLWTEDPVNDSSRYDPNTGIALSCIDLIDKEDIITETLKNDGVKFVYQGKSGLQVRLGGTFTAWDSWIYELEETSPGYYELTLPLPKGKYFYNYFIGMNCEVDKTNPNRSYTQDGRVASVINVN